MAQIQESTNGCNAFWVEVGQLIVSLCLSLLNFTRDQICLNIQGFLSGIQSVFNVFQGGYFQNNLSDNIKSDRKYSSYSNNC